MKSCFACIGLLCLSAYSKAGPVVYSLTLGDYSYFGDWHSNLTGVTDSLTAVFKVERTPDTADLNSAHYSATLCSVSSGTFGRSFFTGSMDVTNGNGLFSGDQLRFMASNPAFPPFTDPIDSLDISLKGAGSLFDSTQLPTTLSSADFPMSSFRLVVGEGPRLGSVVEGRVLDIHVSANPEPASWLALSCGLAGIGWRRRRSQRATSRPNQPL